MRFKGVAARCSRRLEWQSLRPFNKSRRSRRRRTMRIVPRRPVDASNPCHCWRYYIVVLKMSLERKRFGGTELLQRVLADACEACGSTVNVEVHQVRKLADLNRRDGRPPPDWV